MKKAIQHASEDMDVVRLRILKETKNDFKRACEQNEQSMSAVLLDLIEKYIDETLY